MYLLHNIGDILHPNYNSRAQVSPFDGLTFDGVYKNVYQNRDLLKGKSVTLFVIGFAVGKDNTFDLGQPYEEFCTWDELFELRDLGCEIGWHTWHHRDLTTLSYGEILKEITPPFPMKAIAFPYGKYNEEVLKAVQQLGYESAFAASTRPRSLETINRPSPYTQPREYLPFHNAELAETMWGGLKAHDRSIPSSR